MPKTIIIGKNKYFWLVLPSCIQKRVIKKSGHLNFSWIFLFQIHKEKIFVFLMIVSLFLLAILSEGILFLIDFILDLHMKFIYLLFSFNQWFIYMRWQCEVVGPFWRIYYIPSVICRFKSWYLYQMVTQNTLSVRERKSGLPVSI